MLGPFRPAVAAAGALLMGLVLGPLGGCAIDGILVEPKEPAPFDTQIGDRVDDDGDGHMNADDSGSADCDDSNPDIHPGATETPGDGVDSNCDGEDDT